MRTPQKPCCSPAVPKGIGVYVSLHTYLTWKIDMLTLKKNKFTLFKSVFCVTLLFHAYSVSANDSDELKNTETFSQQLSSYADELKSFPIDFLLMPTYQGIYKGYIKRYPQLANSSAYRKRAPPWSYYPFRYEMNEDQLNLWRSFIFFAYYASEEAIESCQYAIDNAIPKERALLLAMLFLSADEKYLDVFEKYKNDQSITFPAITISEEDKANFAKKAEDWLQSDEGKFWSHGGPCNGIEFACMSVGADISFQVGRSSDELVIDYLAENSSETPKTVADFANAFLWYWYHFEEDQELDQGLLFSKFMEDDRTIPVFPDEKYEELKKRLESETFYYTKTSIRMIAMYNSPWQYRTEILEEVRQYVRALPEDAHFLLQIKRSPLYHDEITTP